MTPQEFLDTAARKIHAQGEPSVRSLTGRCVYRGNGSGGQMTKCAIGQFIPDELYTPAMEDMSFGTICFLLAERGIFEHSQGFDRLAGRVQSAHDFAARDTADEPYKVFLEVFLAKMREAALLHELSTAVIDELAAKT